MRDWLNGFLICLVGVVGGVGCKKGGEPGAGAGTGTGKGSGSGSGAGEGAGAGAVADAGAVAVAGAVADAGAVAVAGTGAGPRPGWYPAGFALPAGWRTEGPVSVTPHATSGELAWDRPLAEVLGDFQKELASGGWTMKSDEPRGKGGKRMRWEKGGETVQLSVFEVGGKAHAIVVPPIRLQ